MTTSLAPASHRSLANGVRIFGRFAEHPQADEFATRVHRGLCRYAEEVVLPHALCPFLKDVETGFGTMCVMLDDALDPAIARAALISAPSAVTHLVYPLIGVRSPVFERFATAVNESLRGEVEELPVHATFHPALAGGVENAHRIIGLLRRAPDPFIQFIPSGLHQGGTVLATFDGPRPVVPKDNTERIFAMLTPPVLQSVLDKMEEIRVERHASCKENDAFSKLAEPVSESP